MSEQPADMISQAVAKARAQSKNPPKLNRPKAPAGSMKKTLDERAAVKALKTLGRESGPDGRAPRRGLGIPSLADVLHTTIQKQGWQEDLGHGWIFGHWAQLVGDAVAAHATPERIDNKILHIACDHSSWATNLRYLQAEILRKIAENVGDDVIVELRIHGPRQHRNYEGPQWVKPQGSQDTYG